MEIFKQNDAQSAAAEAGEYLNNWLTENLKLPVLLMLSGGSAFSILEYVGKTAIGANLTLSVLDERFSQDTTINNFAQLEKTDFFTDALNAECSFFGTLPRNGETAEQLAQRWEKSLQVWKQENPKGLIAVTLGLGADGHTAGIFPYPENSAEFDRLFKKNDWIVAYNAGGKSQFPERVTATPAFFKLIDLGLAYVCGAKKQTALSNLAAKKGNIYELPALAWDGIPDVKVFTDLQI